MASNFIHRLVMFFPQTPECQLVTIQLVVNSLELLEDRASLPSVILLIVSEDSVI